jgi:hypothetical protein
VRAVVAAGLLALHVGIWAFTGIHFFEAMVLLVVFGWPGRRAEPPVPVDVPRLHVIGPSLVAGVLVLGLVLSPIEARRHAADRWGRIEGRRERVEAIGPLRVGARVAEAEVTSLALQGTHAHVCVRRAVALGEPTQPEACFEIVPGERVRVTGVPTNVPEEERRRFESAVLAALREWISAARE